LVTAVRPDPERAATWLAEDSERDAGEHGDKPTAPSARTTPPSVPDADGEVCPRQMRAPS